MPSKVKNERPALELRNGQVVEKIPLPGLSGDYGQPWH